MYSYSRQLNLLHFIIHLHANDSRVLDILCDDFIYNPKAKNDFVRSEFHFYILVEDDDRTIEKPKGDFSYSYDFEANVLHLKYLNGAINIDIDYTKRSVFAVISRSTLFCGAALGNWIMTIPMAEFLKEYGMYFIHAACLEYEGKSVLFAGKSGYGKTTISLGLMKMGWNLIADDEVFLFDKVAFYAVGGPEKAKISYKTWQKFVDILGETDVFPNKRTINLSVLFPDKMREFGKVHSLCLIRQGTENRINRLKPIDAFQCLFSLAFLNSNPESTRSNFEFLANLCRNCYCYDLENNLDFDSLHTFLLDELFVHPDRANG